MLRLLATVVCLSIFVTVSDSARILAIFPTPSISHQIVFRPITLELAKRGHNVVVITTDPMFARDQTPANYTEIDAHDVSYSIWEEFVIESSSNTKSHYENVKKGLELLTVIIIKQWQMAEVQNIFQNKENMFDLLLIEACARSALLWSHFYKVPVIQISSLGSIPGIYEDVGNPTHPDFYPTQLRQRIYNLSIWDKIIEYYSNYLSTTLADRQKKLDHQQLRKVFGLNFPSLDELKNNIDMTFINIRPSWDFNRPKVPSVVYLGGSHGNISNGLDEELQSYLDSSANGVIYMSFGTNIKPSNFPRPLIKIILNVLASLPYDVLWKWDKDDLDGRPKNVKISKWFPQYHLLHHPKIKLFITQGGLQSTDEAITARVPLLGIPIHSDQWYNTEMYVYHKIGLQLDIKKISEENFKNAINTILSDDRYRANINKLQRLMNDEPQTPLERIICWTEHILRNGGAKHLRAPAADMPWTEYFELELVFIILGFLVLLIKLFVFSMKIAKRSLFTVLFKVKFKMN